MSTKPNIFDYNDFRKFLLDYYGHRHTSDKTFSKAYICKELGLPNSRSYFQDVINGKFVSQLKIPLFLKLLDLSPDEARYFRALVNFNQAVHDPQEREFLFEQLISLNRTPKKAVEPSQYNYYKEWYHSVMRAVLNIVDFPRNGSYLKLGRRIFPPITEVQARSSVNLLLELGLIQENSAGFLKPTAKAITTGAYARDEIIRQYQIKSLDIAKSALLKNMKDPQRVITKMISISEQGYKRMEKLLDKFNSEVTSAVHKDENLADRVYQLNIMLFPHSKRGPV